MKPEIGKTDLTESASEAISGYEAVKVRLSGSGVRKGIVLAVLILVTAGVMLYWQRVRSPEYSLWKAWKAVKQHDLASFEKYVDVDEFVSRMIDQVIEQSQKDIPEVTDPWSKLGQAIGMGLVQLMKPKLVQVMKTQVIHYIEKGDFESSEKRSDTQGPKLKELVQGARGEKAKFERIEYVKRDGKIAIVGIKFSYPPQYTGSAILDVKMRDKDGYWQVTKLSNSVDFSKKVEALQKPQGKSD